MYIYVSIYIDIYREKVKYVEDEFRICHTQSMLVWHIHYFELLALKKY